jgi:hypothetical protein
VQRSPAFPGGFGTALAKALAAAGMDRSQIYARNALNHRKNVLHGKRRIHQKHRVNERSEPLR